MPTFHNPTGVVLNRFQRQQLADLATKFEVPLIEDNTLAELELEPVNLPPIAAYNQNANVITIGSMSKLFWAGLRIGWVRAAPGLITRLGRLKIVADLGSGTINQVIALRLLGQIEQVKEVRRQALLLQRDLMLELLTQHLPTWQWNRPGGGLFVWVQLPFGNASEFAQLALRYGVAFTPGTRMSVDESHVNYLRMAFLLEPAKLIEGITRLSRAWQSYTSLKKVEHSNLRVTV